MCLGKLKKNFFKFFKKIFKLKIKNKFLAVVGLCCCTWAFSSCGEQGLLFVVVSGLLIAVVSLVAEARALGVQASVVVALRLSSCGSWTLERKLGSCGAQA